MTTQNLSHEKRRYTQDTKKYWVDYSTTRLHKDTLKKIKSRASVYQESVDDIVQKILLKLEEFEKQQELRSSQ